MLKTLMTGAAFLIGSGLNAETIGDVEFQFPPSNYEWTVLGDNNTPFFTNEKDDDDDFEFKILTHREGDALELFLAIQFPKDDDEEDDCEIDTMASIQKELDEMLNQFLPNHRLNVVSFTESDTEGFFEWELCDGSLDLLHGYTRGFEKNGSTVTLSYFTTALRTEIHRAIWINVLNQAK